MVVVAESVPAGSCQVKSENALVHSLVPCKIRQGYLYSNCWHILLVLWAAKDKTVIILFV